MRIHTSIYCVLFLFLTAPREANAELTWPPSHPDGKEVVTDQSADFLMRPPNLKEDVTVAQTPPTIDFIYCPGQDYLGRPWSDWGEGLATDGKYYGAIGDHKGPDGNALVFEYDSKTKKIRTVVDLKKLLKLPEGHYCPGKIHSRIDKGNDGWLYFSTHRGSTRVTTDEYHYKGDWIIRYHPATEKTEIVVQAPVPKQCIPSSVLDPERLIFYGGTAAGDYSDKRIMFFAYDITAKKLLYSDFEGPYRYLLYAKSTGRVYYTKMDGEPLKRFDPAKGPPAVQIDARIGLRAATQETPQGFVYTVSTRGDSTLWSFNTKTEVAEKIGSAPVGSQSYVTSLDVDPAGRYLYYMPGAHGGSEHDGTPVVQFDLKTRKKKVIAFLHPFYQKKYGYTPLGTFGSAIDEKGEKLYVTWNGNRGGAVRGRLDFDTCALMVIHIPESERRP